MCDCRSGSQGAAIIAASTISASAVPALRALPLWMSINTDIEWWAAACDDLLNFRSMA